MRSASLDRAFIRSKDVMFRELDGEAVILNLNTGTYFGLNAVGTRIWYLIGQHGRLDAVLDELYREYDATPAQLEQDLLDLVGRLVEAHLVELKPHA